MRPKLYIDTDICIKAAGGNLEDWDRVQKHIAERYRYQISFITMKEVFSRLTRGDESFYEANKRSLNVLYGHGRRWFLPYPSCFAIRTALGYAVSRTNQPNDWPEKKAA